MYVSKFCFYISTNSISFLKCYKIICNHGKEKVFSLDERIELLNYLNLALVPEVLQKKLVLGEVKSFQYFPMKKHELFSLIIKYFFISVNRKHSSERLNTW